MHEEVNKVADHVIEQIEKLINHGAQNFIISSLPDLAATPRAQETDQLLGHSNFSKQLHRISITYQKLLEYKVSALQKKYPKLKVFLIKAYDIQNSLLENPQKYNIKYTTGRCNPNGFAENILPFCDNPSDYFFWDDLHPSSHTHKVMSDIFYETIINNGFSFNKDRKILSVFDPIYQQNKRAIDELTKNKIDLRNFNKVL